MQIKSGRWQHRTVSALQFCRIAVSKTLLVFCAFILGALFAASVLNAQSSGGVTSSSGGSGTGRSALRYNNNVLELRSPDTATFAPTVYGVLMPPELEPTSVEQHRAIWTWCEQSGDLLTCEDRINFNGNVLRKASVTFQLPSTQ